MPFQDIIHGGVSGPVARNISLSRGAVETTLTLIQRLGL